MSTPRKGRPAKNPQKKFKRLAITMPPEVEEMLRKASYDTGKSLSEIVTESVLLELGKSAKMIRPLPSSEKKANGTNNH